MPNIFEKTLISQHYNDLLASYFSINKTREFISHKYHWPGFCKDVKAYFKECDM